MFSKKKSVPEKVFEFVGDAVDGHGVDIARGVGGIAGIVALAVVGASAIINVTRTQN